MTLQILLFSATTVGYLVYTWWLFKNFRRKVYMDMMDFIIIQNREAIEEALKNPPSKPSNRGHIRLVSNTNQDDGM